MVKDASLDGRLIQFDRTSVITVSTGRPIAAGDFGQYLRTEGTSALILSVPVSSSAIPAGFWFELNQRGTGQVTFVAESGVSIAVRTSGTLMTARKGAVVKMTQVGGDTWDLVGDVSIT